MKKELIAFPFHKYTETILSADILAPFRQQANWLLPQSMAFLATLPLAKSGGEAISMKETWKLWLEKAKASEFHILGSPVTFDWFKGFIRIINHAPRGEILGSRMTQSKPEGARWAASVPLILSAFKEYNNVLYSSWDLDPNFLLCFTDKNIASVLVLYPYECPFTKEELIEIRNETDNGKQLTKRTTITTCSNIEFNSLPKHLKTMLCQVWVWHPSIRHKYAITNLQKLDEPAEPLITSEVFDMWGELPKDTKKPNEDIPWDV